MVADNSTSAESLWRSIRREADAVAAGDAALGRSISLSILDHPGLGTAVAFQIGQRLGTDSETRALFTRIAHEAFSASPDLVEAASCDLQAIVLHDPASKALLPALLNKGYVALQAWRVANWLWRRDRTDLALLLQSASSEQLQVSMLVIEHDIRTVAGLCDYLYVLDQGRLLKDGRPEAILRDESVVNAYLGSPVPVTA